MDTGWVSYRVSKDGWYMILAVPAERDYLRGAIVDTKHTSVGWSALLDSVHLYPVPEIANTCSTVQPYSGERGMMNRGLGNKPGVINAGSIGEADWQWLVIACCSVESFALVTVCTQNSLGDSTWLTVTGTAEAEERMSGGATAGSCLLLSWEG